MTHDYMITTVDNPWNPHTHYDEWLVWDHEHQYFTQEVLGRLSLRYIENLEDEEDVEVARLMAIDDMLSVNYDLTYAKIYKDDKTPMIPGDIV